MVVELDGASCRRARWRRRWRSSIRGRDALAGESDKSGGAIFIAAGGGAGGGSYAAGEGASTGGVGARGRWWRRRIAAGASWRSKLSQLAAAGPAGAEGSVELAAGWRT
jgi:hypothetical protein